MTPGASDATNAPSTAAPEDVARPSEDGDDDCCAVCLDVLSQSDTLRWPACAHRLHVQCALQLAQYSPRCPVCRKEAFAPRRRDLSEVVGDIVQALPPPPPDGGDHLVTVRPRRGPTIIDVRHVVRAPTPALPWPFVGAPTMTGGSPPYTARPASTASAPALALLSPPPDPPPHRPLPPPRVPAPPSALPSWPSEPSPHADDARLRRNYQARLRRRVRADADLLDLDRRVREHRRQLRDVERRLDAMRRARWRVFERTDPDLGALRDEQKRARLRCRRAEREWTRLVERVDAPTPTSALAAALMVDVGDDMRA